MSLLKSGRASQNWYKSGLFPVILVLLLSKDRSISIYLSKSIHIHFILFVCIYYFINKYNLYIDDEHIKVEIEVNTD